ncbi:MAG: RNA polymerase sigma factor [Kofleriaceae bacterium]
MEDDDIREALRQGDDHRAFRLLGDHHGVAVFRACAAVLRDPAAAEDAMQDALMKAFRKRRKLMKVASVRGYVLVIARRTALDAARKRQRRTQLDAVHAAEPVAAAPTSREARELAALDECLAALEPSTALAVTLFYRDAQPWAVIATQVGLALDTVRMRARRALKDLAACMAAKGVA